MSGGSSANNSWTILTPEQTVAETLRPVAEGTDHHEESHTSAAGSGENNQPANGAESAEGLPVEDYPVSEGKTATLSGDSSPDQHTSVPTTVPDNLIPSSLEVPGSPDHGDDEVSQTQVLPEDSVQISADPDSSSDSYTHITPSPDEPPLSLLSTEILGGADFALEEEKLTQEETLHPLNGEELHQEDEEAEHYSRTPDIGKQAESTVDSEVGDERTEKTGEEGDPEVRRRRSLLAALEQIGRREEEEAEQEEYQLPQREDDSGFSVNKCILGAVILLGLGTIFFSENEYGTRELKDTAIPGKQEWLNPEVPPVDVDNSELLNKLAEGNEQISVLQAQLQAQKEELNVAKGHAAEGAKERLQWEEVEKENTSQTSQAPAKPPIPPPSGQPEDSMQSITGSMRKPARKPLDDQKEKKKDLKRDKYDVGEKKEWKVREKSVWKEGEIKERKDGGKPEWKRGKYEFDKEKEKEGKQKRHGEETKQWKEKSWKTDKDRRGDEGKPWKDREGKKEWLEKSEKKEWKEEKDRKRGKHEKVNEGKQRRDKDENRDWKGGKDHGERRKNKEEWKGGKEWKKEKNGFKESGKDKWEKKEWKEKGKEKGEKKEWKEKGEKKEWKEEEWKEKGEKKEWKEKGEKKEWKKDTEWRNKNGNDWGKEGKERRERKQWEDDKNHGKEKRGKYERKQQNEPEWKSKNGKHDKDWKRKDEERDQQAHKEKWKRGGQKETKNNGDERKDGSNTQKKHFPGNHGHREEHLYGDRKPPHSHHAASMEQPEYWLHQRDRLHHNPKPPQQCDSVESCAQAERLLPVPLPEFEAVLQTYLSKAEEAGVDKTKIGELQKLTTDFFKDGLFVHDQMSFQDFVEDVGDILEDMVEGDNDEEEEEEDSAIEEEMEGFEREVMKKFSMPGAGEKEQRIKGEWRKESGQGRG